MSQTEPMLIRSSIVEVGHRVDDDVLAPKCLIKGQQAMENGRG